MERHPPLSVPYIFSRLLVDTKNGRAFWIDATKYHKRLVGKEAGSIKKRGDKSYWVIKIDGIPYLRSQIILAIASGRWPRDQVDHKDGNSLNDEANNLRPATPTQNSWNHKTRKRRIQLSMGVRIISNGRYAARISVKKKHYYLGTFDTADAAHSTYLAARKEHYGEFA